jgi:hypothetical protein
MLPSILSSIHKVTRDVLEFSIANMEEENSRLKGKIKELEATPMPPPILASPILMIWPKKSFQETLDSSARVKGISRLIITS